jgi:hypothetical protein
VPSLDDDRTRYAETRDSAAARQFVDREEAHCHRARRANLNRDDAGGEFGFAGVHRERGETDERVGPADFVYPQLSVAEVLGLADECEAGGESVVADADVGLKSEFLG